MEDFLTIDLWSIYSNKQIGIKEVFRFRWKSLASKIMRVKVVISTVEGRRCSTWRWQAVPVTSSSSRKGRGEGQWRSSRLWLWRRQALVKVAAGYRGVHEQQPSCPAGGWAATSSALTSTPSAAAYGLLLLCSFWSNQTGPMDLRLSFVSGKCVSLSVANHKQPNCINREWYI